MPCHRQLIRQGGDGSKMVPAGPPPGDIRQQVQDLLRDPAAAWVGKLSGLDGLSEPCDGLIHRTFYIRHVSVFLTTS